MGHHCGRPVYECARELENYRDSNPEAFAKRTPLADPSRGELRLTAEVLIEELHGRDVPSFAHQRVIDTLNRLARD